MTSEKQTRANRQNALKSTGPKTPEGKAAVRHNAIKHGLLAEEVLLPGEDEAAFADLGERLRDELQPVGELENMLVNRIIGTSWRLRRIGRVEAGIFAWEHYGELAEQAQQEAQASGGQDSGDGPERDPHSGFLKQPSPIKIVDPRKYQEHLSEAAQMKARQNKGTAPLGRTFIRDADGANAFSKLSRYETAIERSHYKALHELQRLQAARRAEGNVSPPLAIDVEVSGDSGEGL